MSDLRQRVSSVFYDSGAEPVRDPAYELARLAGKLARTLDNLGLHVNELGELRYSSAMGLEQRRAEVDTFLDVARLLGALLSQLSKLDLVSKVEVMQTRYGDLVTEMFNMVITNLNLTDDQYKKLDQAMPRIVEYITPKIEQRDGFKLIDGEIVLLEGEVREPESERDELGLAEPVSLIVPDAATEALVDGVTSQLKDDMRRRDNGKKKEDDDSTPYIDQALREAKAHDDLKLKAKRRFEMIKNQTEANRKRMEQRNERFKEYNRRVSEGV